MQKLYNITLIITLMALLSACGGKSKSGADSEHGLVNTPPTAESQSITTGKNSQYSITLKATDANADKLSYRITTPPRHGRLSGTAPVLIYRPDRDYVGEDSFTFIVSDGVLDSDEVTVSITIGDSPAGSDDNASTGGDDNSSTGGTDNNGSTGDSDDNASTGASDSNTTAGGSDSNTSDNADNNSSSGSDNNTSTGGNDNNSSTGGTDNNSTGGSDSNSSTGGSDDNGTSGGSNDNNTSTGDDNSTAGGSGTDDNATGGGTDTNTTTLKSLKLTIAETTLNKEHNTTLTLKATYDDNTTKTPSSIAWLINPNDAVSIQGNTLTAIKDSNVTIQAKAGNTLSNKVTLNIYWEVNGYRLPPEPDPKVNNATLLGVDVNHNGVRDDVERWIYDKYKDKHPIHIDIAMQAARGYRLILEKQPKTREEAKSIMGEVDKAIDCQAYYMFSAKYFNEPILLQYKAVDEYFRGKVYFNTKERYDAYIQYDTLLSGDSYTLPSFEEEKAACDFNTSKYEE